MYRVMTRSKKGVFHQVLQTESIFEALDCIFHYRKNGFEAYFKEVKSND